MDNLNTILNFLYKTNSSNSLYIYIGIGVFSLLVLFIISAYTLANNLKEEKIRKLEEETLRNIKTIKLDDEDIKEEVYENRYISVYIEPSFTIEENKVDKTLSETSIRDTSNVVDLDEVIKLDREDFLNRLKQMKNNKE